MRDGIFATIIPALRRAMALACAVLLLSGSGGQAPTAAFDFGHAAVSVQFQGAPLIRASALPLVAIVKSDAAKPITAHGADPALAAAEVEPLGEGFAPHHANARASAFVRLRLAAFAARAPPSHSA